MNNILVNKKILNSNILNLSRCEVIQNILALAKQKTSSYICIANVHMVVESYLNPDFNRIINSAALVLPDGKPLSFFMNLLYHTSQRRIAGPDLMVDLFNHAAKEGFSVFFYGSSASVLSAMQEKLFQEYPNLKVAGMLSPPFRALTAQEEKEHFDCINQSGANIVFVSLGCPKQEFWMHSHQDKINAVMIGVGAAFPFFTGHLDRAPKLMQDLSLEWLYRLYKEPRRLAKRYLITNTLFLLLIHIQLMYHFFHRKD